MTHAGELFELPMPEPPTDAPASSSLLPTPTTSDCHPPRKIPRRDGKAHEFDKLANAVWYLFSAPNCAMPLDLNELAPADLFDHLAPTSHQ
jgi:hypothetical protein